MTRIRTLFLAPGALLLGGALATAPVAAQGAAPPFELPAWETANEFSAIPHPRDVFGFEPGADYELATNAQIVEYFDALDSASERVRVERIGDSVLGRPMILAYISSEENIARMEEWRETARDLAMGRITRDEARRRAADGKAVVWVDGGLHATEVAGAQHTPLLAYRVAGEESEEMRRIRDDVILLLMPVMNPDGLDLVADWTRRGRDTEWAGSSPPVLYQFYTGHDNNRDWFMITQPETRAVTDVLYHRWFPQIVLNQHQTAPWPARIFIPPFADPVNPHIQPLTIRGVNKVGNAMGTRLSEEGKTGAIARVSFDMWWNGGMRTVPYFHNMVGILTETAHASVAPEYTAPSALPEYIRGTLPAREPSVFYPDPWQGGWFRLRDAVEYMITAAMATLDVASANREEFLFNIWRMGADAVAAGETGGPFAYIVPPDQRNPLEAANMLNVLRKGGVEVHRAPRPLTAAGERYPAGSYVVLAGQAFRPHLMDLLEEQVYPDMRLYPGGPPDTPYDISGWTLPIQMDVVTDRIDEPFDASGLVAVDEAAVWPGRTVGGGSWGWAVRAESNAAAIAANRLLADGAEAYIAPDGALAGDDEMGRGAYVFRGVTEADAGRLARELGVDFVGMDREPRDRLHRLDPPRLGIYKSWQANMDEGWTRWVLKEYGFPVDTLHDAEIRGADLSGYDAIILPDQNRSSILHGHAPGTRPEEITGGIGLEGMLRLQRYVEGGGRLIAFDEASELLIDQLGIPLRNTVEDLPYEDFFVPGTLIRMTVDTDHPLGYGMSEEVAGFFARSRAWDVRRADGVDVIARYADEDLVMSGWSLGEGELAGRAALVRAPIGAGDVVLFAFRPQFRAQPRGTFKFLFNALHGAAARDAAVEGPAGRPVEGARRR